MGLDQSIRTERIDKNYDSEIIYFRRFYPFGIWVQKNCEQIKDDFEAIFKITKKDLIEFVDFVKNRKEEDLFDTFKDYPEQIKRLEDLIPTLKSNKSYYYTFC